MKARRTVALLSVASIALLAACGSSPRTHQQLSDIRSHPTPEVVTLSDTEDGLNNDWAIYLNEMQRMRREDLRQRRRVEEIAARFPGRPARPEEAAE